MLLKCSTGFFVEFGARNGIEHSNTHYFEKQLRWRGLLFEVDPKEFSNLKANRPGATVYQGAVCPRGMTELTFGLSINPGWSGQVSSYEPSRSKSTTQVVKVKCYQLAEELRRHGIRTVDYMTIDTEGSEPEIIEDFPWAEFDVRVVQIEQLDERRYPAQRGKKDRVRRFMVSHGYDFHKAYTVADFDTEDLIFTRSDRTDGAESVLPMLHHVMNATTRMIGTGRMVHHGSVPSATKGGATTRRPLQR